MFSSKAERDRYHVLLDEQKAGRISSLTLQPRWRFPINGKELAWKNRAIFYTADFLYQLPSGETVVEDVKGFVPRDVHIRIALMEAVHGIKVRLVRGAKG